jgi:hypothetical protein
MLSVIMLSVVMLTVVAPLKQPCLISFNGFTKKVKKANRMVVHQHLGLLLPTFKIKATGFHKEENKQW